MLRLFFFGGLSANQKKDRSVPKWHAFVLCSERSNYSVQIIRYPNTMKWTSPNMYYIKNYNSCLKQRNTSSQTIMLESLLMQQCFGSGVRILLWDFNTNCDDELARSLAPINWIFLIVFVAAVGLVLYRKKRDSKKTWKQMVKAELSILRQVVTDPIKEAWHLVEYYQKASRLRSNE